MGGLIAKCNGHSFWRGKASGYIEFDIINQEGEDTNYTIEVIADGELYTESVLIRYGEMFTYIHHFYSGRLTSNEVSFAVYKEGESAPVEEGAYFLE